MHRAHTPPTSQGEKSITIPSPQPVPSMSNLQKFRNFLRSVAPVSYASRVASRCMYPNPRRLLYCGSVQVTNIPSASGKPTLQGWGVSRVRVHSMQGLTSRFPGATHCIDPPLMDFLTPQMTAKMLNRQATKAHKESESQKAKVKKVLPGPMSRGLIARRFNRGTMILQGSMLGMLFGRSKSG